MSLPALKERKVAGLKRSYVKCRALGHAWDETAAMKERPVQGFHESARCARCTSERVFWMGWDGKAVARWYEYPEDFETVTAMTRAEAHLWLEQHRVRPVEEAA